MSNLSPDNSSLPIFPSRPEGTQPREIKNPFLDQYLTQPQQIQTNINEENDFLTQ